MTAMPFPGMTWPVRHEVGSTLVLHPLWESQKDPDIIVGGLRAIGRAEFRTHTTRQKKKKTVRETAKVAGKRMLACLFLITTTGKGEKKSRIVEAWRQENIY